MQQLDAFTNPVREGSEKDNMLYELILKAGYLLTDKVEKIENLYSIKNGELLIAIESINQATVDKMITLRPKSNFPRHTFQRQRPVENQHRIANERCRDRF